MADVEEGAQEGSAAPSLTKAKPVVLPDPVYEFSAPRFYDFATNSQDRPASERADAWFDTAGTDCKHEMSLSMPTYSCSVCVTVHLCFVALANTTSQMPDPQQVAIAPAAKGVLAETERVVAMVKSLCPTILSVAHVVTVN